MRLQFVQNKELLNDIKLKDQLNLFANIYLLINYFEVAYI